MTTNPMDAPNRWDALLAAMNAYRDQFRRDLWTWHMDPARIPAVVQAMRQAMAAGHPLSANDAAAVTGISPQPMDAMG